MGEDKAGCNEGDRRISPGMNVKPDDVVRVSSGSKAAGGVEEVSVAAGLV